MNYLILLNDHVNSFHKVQAALIKVCKHNPVQAEQCCLIAHHNNKCTVKQGDFMDLLEMSQQLDRYNIKTELQAEKV